MRGGALWGYRVFAAAALPFVLGGAPRDDMAQAAPRTHVLIVTGASGEPRFAKQFHQVAMNFRTAAITK